MQEERLKLRTAIKNDLSKDEEVLAIFYGGSIARGNDDLYSDLDLRVVVTEDSHSKHITRKKERAKNWGDVLFFEDRGPFVPYSIAHFKNFVKVDTFYYKPQDLQASIYLKEEADIDYDPYGLVKEAKEKSQEKIYELTFDEFDTWRGKFFGYLHEAYRRVMRNETYYALQSVDWMRWSIVTGWYLEKGYLPNEPGSWSKYEGERSKLEEWQLSLLESWDCNRNQQSIVNAYKLMIPEFKRVHKALSKKLNIEEMPEWVDEIFNEVL
ncbi:nucleotidyltransferase domain-containing protein [Halalkalibacter flavus]|uniref:nucleotidyltransferase domain-containing protein n=1 Tax=Halalkalibacter flavus TaxID=3090668 RepID=UPI002FCB6DF1